MGCYQISLGDTIGVGTPLQTRGDPAPRPRRAPAPQIAMHMHDTRGTALANILVGLELGIRDFDASVGGSAAARTRRARRGTARPRISVYMLDGMGVRSGVNLERLVEAGRAAESIVGRKLPGKVHQSGVRSLRA